ncbi:MAG: hypothetical protein CO150_03705 [Nitrospirae bacterium CG_4_9_14_3_um_filter_53_35]|nr:MAG: hypothetical protein COT35_13695 [Nitrospirae bacterium CG08_land_8_20_14_0_20_52_24]PIV85169.1 MAG: hypothetical protein COW52_03680 [Nitrospirae bacterium CG17_big_fil_post_rev_8_21_14_2_50_50_9]PIW86199.1 MAG: hypothetical protein COZ95_00495 [Nitrospirae bacterium CG_4_8_14_3_um_filter_50_41]PIX84927.1 MAG: hypothetical protein COZ32_11175 [Nitrospirae bacterium CG_4_10_14_3_um_filter_53_41]PJA76145.1 MAG: hypothetical protein CO150_03705 [Nitrospirae bacterium CG_4_9_14_3_um_filter
MQIRPSRMLQQIHPNFLLIGSFVLTILAGGIFLHAPFSLREGHISIIDALFTATSAVCVTGLSVVDIGTRFNTTGQMILLLMIQLGGLGIMTYTTVVMLLLGKKLSFRGKEAIQGTLSYKLGQGLLSLIKNVFLVTILFEGIGLIFLFIRWSFFFPPREALYNALFHSVSAFCNAGLSLFSRSLMDFRDDPWINAVMVLLIISGGLGFVVVQDIRQYINNRLTRKKRARLSLHSRIVLVTTSSLVLSGLVIFLMLEWRHALSGVPFGEKILISLFQSVTPRTAGFNTMDYNLLTNGTLLFTIFFMFIGASPGSTGGGIKTTSFAVLLAMALAKWKNRSETFIFGRTVPAGAVSRTISIFLASILLVILSTLALMITDAGDIPVTESRGLFIQYLFETVSAFGTVGLSTGVTPSLSVPGKLILMVLMFVGRLGPITIALAITSEKRDEGFTYPEENIMVG